ncbi:MAG: ROK family protein [Verrucomicrobia bacterium]|nr:MAG: ROK family protein [Verrucomicrobiota bacterium]
MKSNLNVPKKIQPILDRSFLPAVLWNRAYAACVTAEPRSLPLVLALQRPDGLCYRHELRILPHTGGNVVLNLRYVERILKVLLWMKGGSRILVGGCAAIADALRAIYAPGGARAFDVDLIGRKVFLDTLRVEACRIEDVPAAKEPTVALGRHLDGCRIGFDLGGSDRKCAAVIEGKVVHAEEVPWDPCFQKDPQYHIAGIRDSLRRAAAKLPRVDAIGGSAAGVYINNEPRVASLFRGLAPADFDHHIRPLFHNLRQEWNNVPFEVVNDGEVTALAGSMAMNDNAVLGISMGTSVAVGYCDERGRITTWLNELAFTPADYRVNAPADEWSGDLGCGVQYFCQQGVARLAPKAGLEFPAGMKHAEQLIEVQKLMAAGDKRARRIYETIGVCFGYEIAHYAEFYRIRNLLILGRVVSGRGGEVILERAGAVLRAEFPELAEQIRLRMPNEQDKRHGQAIAAASLPAINQKAR